MGRRRLYFDKGSWNAWVKRGGFYIVGWRWKWYIHVLNVNTVYGWTLKWVMVRWVGRVDRMERRLHCGCRQALDYNQLLQTLIAKRESIISIHASNKVKCNVPVY